MNHISFHFASVKYANIVRKLFPLWTMNAVLLPLYLLCTEHRRTSSSNLTLENYQQMVSFPVFYFPHYIRVCKTCNRTIHVLRRNACVIFFQSLFMCVRMLNAYAKVWMNICATYEIVCIVCVSFYMWM